MALYSSLEALDRLITSLDAGPARVRQLRWVRGELELALERDVLGVSARRSAERLLAEDTLALYLRLAESGALRTRLVGGQRPPTSGATNEIRRQCVDALRDAVGLPALLLGGGALPLQPTPAFGDLAALRRQLDRDLAGHMPPGRIRLTAVLGLVLDAAPRSGELAALRLDHVTPGTTAVYIERRPQRGGGDPDGEGGHFELSPLTRAALSRWLSVRAELVERAHGTSRLWVSLWHNHDGHAGEEGATLNRPPGMPLEENGLVTSYRRGRTRYGLAGLLPPKLEQLRRAAALLTPLLVSRPVE